MEELYCGNVQLGHSKIQNNKKRKIDTILGIMVPHHMATVMRTIYMSCAICPLSLTPLVKKETDHMVTRNTRLLPLR